VTIVEWPERAGDWLPADRLDIAMDETAELIAAAWC
jgi:tRNA A37 threonylcarbamoyladenosine biosynthesis protein TsaE